MGDAQILATERFQQAIYITKFNTREERFKYDVNRMETRTRLHLVVQVPALDVNTVEHSEAFCSEAFYSEAFYSEAFLLVGLAVSH